MEQSLKEKTRAKRATSLDSSLKIYDVHSKMKLVNISIQDLLSSSKTKAQLAKHFGLALLNKFAGSDQKIVVVEGTQATPNIPYVIPVRILMRRLIPSYHCMSKILWIHINGSMLMFGHQTLMCCYS